MGMWFELAGAAKQGVNQGTNTVSVAAGLEVATVGFRSATSFLQIHLSTAYIVRDQSTHCRSLSVVFFITQAYCRSGLAGL